MNTNGSTSDHEAARSAASKYMMFKLANEEYGLQILKVRELIGFMEITRVPKAPEFVRGVINLRGKIIPVVDLRLKFGIPSAKAGAQTVIIVVQIAGSQGPVTMGILVDEVLEVRDIDAKDVEPPPNFQTQAAADFILGVGKAEKRVIFLLDIDRVLSSQERPLISELGNQQALPAEK